ncbi:inner nuclear membrane protein Man1 isoform X2 [Drosophila busckii]|uniref:inner nuclear membrane protein Man1 isoform X2 n=1 Tax=Drosophila busckii TaxID=30019 RepID=UPI00083EC187|nr:inner nuclear membrane protein Man1 isoform X2 [Drosophila busckii]
MYVDNMSTENLANLSDMEIHRRLKELGYPNTPVTETTRQILIKKLQKHKKNEKLKKSKITNYVLYSMDNSNTASPPPTVPMQRNANLYTNVHDNNNDMKMLRNSSVFHKNATSVNTVQMPASRMYAPPPVLASHYETDNEHHALNITSKYRKPCSPPFTPDNSPAYVKLSSKANNSDGGVVNRLLSFRDTSFQRKTNSKDAYTMYTPKGYVKNGYIKSLLSFDYKSFLKKPDVSQYIIPQVLIASLFIFLTVITVLYTAKKFDMTPISHTDLRYTICDPNERALQTACISEDSFKIALIISKELFMYLNEKARLHHCINEQHSPILDLSEFKKVLSNNHNVQKWNLQSKLLAAQYLIAENPQWMIRTTRPTDTDYNSPDANLKFELIEPSLPLKCIIRKKISRFFTVIGLLLLITAACLAIYFLAFVYRFKRRESLKAAEQFRKDIINELMYHSSQNSENCEVIVNQLQDKLLPSNKRSKLICSWNKALKILEESDSRVLFGMIVRNGEQLRTITWNTNLGNKDLAISKKWQSSALDNSNKIVNPPTSCLKIRHMFDASEIEQPHLRQLIVDSIYEKVGPHCKICDVQLDTQSCCVYIRCATEADAGIVHNEINGWWFDKRLISIKFLRLERFLSRFPKSLVDPLFFKSPNAN